MHRHAYVHHFLSNKELEGQGIDENHVDLHNVTCLSESVSLLLTKFEYTNTLSREEIVFDNGILNWSILEEHIPIGNKESSRFVQNVAKTLEIGEELVALVSKHEKLLKNLHQSFDLISHLLAQKSDYLIFACLSTLTERLIASIFLTMVSRNQSKKQLPNTVSEMLDSEELKQCLGEKCVYIISVLIGPPVMLNLRNIIWHGFCGENELDHYYVSFLVRMYLSICDRVSNTLNGEQFIIKPQILFRISEDDDSARGRGVKKILEIWSGIEHDPLFFTSCRQVVTNSYFNVPFRQPLIMNAFEHYNTAMQDPELPTSQYHLLYSLCILLPQFEHALRRLFVSSNVEIPDRLLCAESEELFSTLDIILANTITVGDQTKPNQIGVEVGQPLIDALFDIFMEYNGPRLRDRVAHCEVSELDPKIVLHFLTLYMALCNRYKRTNEQPIDNVQILLNKFSKEEYPVGLFDCRTLFINQWNLYISETLPNFVPYEQAKHHVSEMEENEPLFDVLKGSFSFGKVKEKTQPMNIEQVITIVKTTKGKSKTPVILSAQDMATILMRALGDNELQSLSVSYKNHFYISEQQASNVNMCSRMIRHHLYQVISVTSEKIDALSEMIEQRTARSANRKTYATYISLVKLVVLSIRLLSSMIVKEYLEMDKEGHDEHFYKKKLASLLKIMTQAERFHEAAKGGTIGTYLSVFTKFVIETRL